MIENHIYQEDCRETIKRMEDKSLDMVFADPFYVPPNIPRKDNYAIDLDGEPWKTGGFSLATGILRRSLVKSKVHYVEVAR